jgi:hypothetical protein
LALILPPPKRRCCYLIQAMTLIPGATLLTLKELVTEVG